MNQSVPIVPLALCPACSTRSCYLAVARVEWRERASGASDFSFPPRAAAMEKERVSAGGVGGG